MIVDVAYAASPSEQTRLTVEVPESCTVRQAIEISGILARHPEIDLGENKVGIFSRPATLETQCQPKDRVEIYRALTIDPKEARLLRAQKKSS